METSKTITRHYAVLNRPFTFEFYGTFTYPAGKQFNVGRGGNHLVEEGMIVVAGHGADFVIPNEYFDLVVEVEVVTKKTTRRPA